MYVYVEVPSCVRRFGNRRYTSSNQTVCQNVRNGYLLGVGSYCRRSILRRQCRSTSHGNPEQGS